MVLKGEEDREVRRILRRLSADVGKVSRPLLHAVEVIARLDFITARARFSRERFSLSGQAGDQIGRRVVTIADVVLVAIVGVPLRRGYLHLLVSHV